jgi:hypothetical protein
MVTNSPSHLQVVHLFQAAIALWEDVFGYRTSEKTSQAKFVKYQFVEQMRPFASCFLLLRGKIGDV